jgi:hypothetical protein
MNSRDVLIPQYILSYCNAYHDWDFFSVITVSNKTFYGAQLDWLNLMIMHYWKLYGALLTFLKVEQQLWWNTFRVWFIFGFLLWDEAVFAASLYGQEPVCLFDYLPNDLANNTPLPLTLVYPPRQHTLSVSLRVKKGGGGDMHCCKYSLIFEQWLQVDNCFLNYNNS